MKIRCCFLVGSLGIVLTAGNAEAAYMQADRDCRDPSISADGQIIAFSSCSSNLAGNINLLGKVFVYHRDRHRILNICRNGPYHADTDCDHPVVSADGQQVLYETGAINLIGGITTDFVVTNRRTKILACTIEASDFAAPAPGFAHKLVSVAVSGAQPNHACWYPVCSSNGRFVAFQTQSDNLDPDTVDTNYDVNNQTWSGWDIYLRDRDLDGNGVFDEPGVGQTKTTRISQDSDIGIAHYASGASISADGRYIAYTVNGSVAPLGRGLGACVHDRNGNVTTMYRPRSYCDFRTAKISPDGGYLAMDPEFADYNRTIMYQLPDTNWWYAVIPRNVSDGIYVAEHGMTPGAHFFAFASSNTNLTDVDNNNKIDVFVRIAATDPRAADAYELVSKSTAGVIGNDDSGDGNGEHPVGITPDGRHVAFISAATNLVAVDTNGVDDVFIRDRTNNTTEIVAQKTSRPVFPAGATLTVSQVGDTSAFFQWTAATDEYPIWEYRLTLSSGMGTTQLVAAGTGTACQATGLHPGTAYTAALHAFDGGANYTETPLSTAFNTTGTGYAGPLITANDERGQVQIAAGQPVDIAVQVIGMDAYAGVGVDWWVVALVHPGTWLYLDAARNWVPFSGNLAACRPVFQGPLFNLPATPIISGLTPATGTYDLWFAVDYPMDGVLNPGGMFRSDQVTVTVQ